MAITMATGTATTMGTGTATTTTGMGMAITMATGTATTMGTEMATTTTGTGTAITMGMGTGTAAIMGTGMATTMGMGTGMAITMVTATEMAMGTETEMEMEMEMVMAAEIAVVKPMATKRRGLSMMLLQQIILHCQKFQSPGRNGFSAKLGESATTRPSHVLLNALKGSPKIIKRKKDALWTAVACVKYLASGEGPNAMDMVLYVTIQGSWAVMALCSTSMELKEVVSPLCRMRISKSMRT
ncbi:hypothetical protein ACJIZ3_011315 [Penstemon smallii]|uniref:Uncharacterized protein n=1 Tax=Penstemon smallii TaxID=265156 RepID=A0ABD3ULZ3_9LAMI